MAFPLMKYLMIIAVWMSLLFAPMSSALHIDESVNEVLLGVDCDGQLRLPLVESQFNLSENLLRALWDAKDLLLDFSPCDYMEHDCSSNFLFKIKNEEVFSIQAHLMRCPNKTRPAMSIVCVGDACSKLMIPCETPNDCGPHLTCLRRHPLATSAYFSQLTSEVVSKMVYPQRRPTSEWQFCGLSSSVSITRSNHLLSENSALIRNDIQQVGSNTDDTPSNTKIFELSCKGGVDLFGRQHFIGILPRAVRIVQTLPLETFDFNTESNLIQHWVEFAGLTVLPGNEFADMINILGLNFTTEHRQSGQTWTVHSRAIDGALTIEVNSCFTEDNALLTISGTSNLLGLLSVRSCTIHTDCPSAMCIPIRDIVKTTREERGLRALFLVEHPHTGVCIPLIRRNNVHPFDAKAFLSEFLQILRKVSGVPKYQRYSAEELIKRENELLRQMAQNSNQQYISPFSLFIFTMSFIICFCLKCMSCLETLCTK